MKEIQDIAFSLREPEYDRIKCSLFLAAHEDDIQMLEGFEETYRTQGVGTLGPTIHL